MAIRKRKHCGNHLSVIPIMLVHAKILERSDKRKKTCCHPARRNYLTKIASEVHSPTILVILSQYQIQYNGMVSVTVTTRLGLMLLVAFLIRLQRTQDECGTLSAAIMLPSFDNYRNARPTQNNCGARSVKRSPKPTRRTIVITLPDRSRNFN